MPRKFDNSPSAKLRRQRVIKRLQNQLLTGYKLTRMEDGSFASVKLEEKDVDRIKKEIEVLKTRL